MPWRNASPTYSNRSEPGLRSSWEILSTLLSLTSSQRLMKPSTPVSRPRKAFCRDSWNVLPIAITSPTDFIWVVSWGSAWGNFSKVNLGILVTM